MFVCHDQFIYIVPSINEKLRIELEYILVQRQKPVIRRERLAAEGGSIEPRGSSQSRPEQIFVLPFETTACFYVLSILIRHRLQFCASSSCLVYRVHRKTMF